MSTQWIVGNKGPVGLNYGVMKFVMARHGVRKRKDRDEVFRDIRILEEAAMDQMRKNT